MEFDLIALLRERCALERSDVTLGIGDDAAVLAPPPGHDLVVCTDTLVEGVHFPLQTEAFDLGWKALAVNLSDLAAMGAMPAWALLALTLPRADPAFVEHFAHGFATLARRHAVALVGGDTTRGPLSITVTAHGFVPRGRALTRAGAREGDAVFVTGTLGDAAGGLACLDPRHVATSEVAPLWRSALIARLHRPEPRIAVGLALRDVASACIDVSDGLLADLGHIATASGVGIDVEARQLPASPALLALFDERQRLRLQASGGDDYELAFTVPEDNAVSMQRDLARSGCGATRIGRVVAGHAVCLRDAEGRRVELESSGWNHFA